MNDDTLEYIIDRHFENLPMVDTNSESCETYKED